jgi:pectate lyase
MSAACNETSWSGPASAATPAPLPVFENSPIGWASYNDLGNNGTTGGAGGSTVDVYDQAALKAAIAQSGPLIIRVHGSIPITGSSGYDIASDKTLTGVGDDATIVGGLRILDKHNIIIRNITFRDNSINDKDGLTIQGTGTHHVWIDHCNIANNADGGIDITHGVDYVTVSWCHFYNQSKVSLVGHSDSNASEDSGHFKVTFHHNWFDATDERHPRVRFSFLTHVFNNYYVAHPSWTENYAVASTCGGYVLVEGCYFQDYIKQYVYSASGYMSSPAGYLCALGNVSVNCISNGLETNCPSDPPSPGTYYAYTLDNAADVPSIVTAGAGAGRLVDDTSAPLPDPMTWEVAPTGITMSSITMVATAASDDSGVEYYFHCLSGGGHDSGWQDSTTYTDTDLVAATTYTYQVKARDKSSNHNETAYSAPASAVTQIYNDTTPPTPDPMAWASVPSAVAGTCDSITMTAATATDLSGVEYYFSNVTDVAHDSGWQDSPVYVDTGLANNTLYTYTVKARDKSINHNATRESVTASAVTLQYVCTGAIAGDLDGDCRCNFADFAPLAEALGTWVPFENLLVNGTFATDIDPWLLTTIGTVYGTVTVDWDGTGGNPPGAAIMNADTTVSGSSQTNNRRFYQVFSVTEGKKYIFSGQWKGDIRGLVTNPTGGTLRNWAEVMINFESGADPCTWSDWTNSSAIKYKKAYGAGTTNTSTGIWDWEEITASKNSGGSPPADDIYTVPAGKSYMVVAFNLGGRANSGTTWISMDNMSVIEHACPAMDLNGDCNLDCTDLAQFAQDWLTCYREPASECWN